MRFHSGFSDETFNIVSNFNYLNEVKNYLHRIMVNDEGIKKEYVELLVMDYTIKHDINVLLEIIHQEPRIVMNVIRRPVNITMRSLDFVIVVQDFVGSNLNPVLFREYNNQLFYLCSQSYVQKSIKFIVINQVESIKDNAIILKLNFELAVFLIGKFDIFNILFIDVFQDNCCYGINGSS